ncbi:MAG TPA: pantoate--beta-alanine ligase [Planctomycetaceae bacterium]|nr:pantoate--beta-alanine ligase [Planctomycetaceae bacterium]
MPQAVGNLVVTGQIDATRRDGEAARREGLRIGLVPTMGALHAGHLSLVDTAREECACVVVTVFVNPSQFGPHEDFDKYPRTLEADLAACRRAGADLVFHPTRNLMYPDGFRTWVDVEGLSSVLEGRFRAGHFRGVTTVVLKLLNVVQPDVAYFGRKDYQQQAVIRRMCADLDLPVEIRTCPTVREPDGLALSSRNRYLNPEERRSALSLSESLLLARKRLLAGETDVEAIRRAMWDHLAAVPLVQPDYATVAHPETLEELARPLPHMVALVAARVNSTRLIDNLPISL